jgi:hypothetical protein
MTEKKSVVRYPALDEVKEASPTDIVRWVRFLPSPTDAQRPIAAAIHHAYSLIPTADLTLASKAVGW